jgi:FLVCR family MFS transporter 7
MNTTSSSTAPFWKLTNGKNGEKYLIFPTNRHRSNFTTSHLNSETAASSEASSTNQIGIKTYKLRWFILTVICLINMSNAINWICYSAIADFTGKFYSIDYDQVNFLSLIYLIITVPAGFVSFIVIDYFGVRSSLNLAGWLNFVGAFLRVLSSIDEADGKPLIPKDYKFFVLMFGQVLCSLAQPFVMFVTTKFANSWFTENQRALANTVALSSNTFGILIGAFISPLIVKSELTYQQEMSTLNFITCGCSLLPAILAAFITRSTPPTPPSYAAIQALRNNADEWNVNSNNNNNNEESARTLTFRENLRVYFEQIGKLLKSMYFILLILSFGLGLGLFNALTTLLQQVLCVRGYTDDDVGIFGGIMIFSGIVGSLIAGIIVDKTKRFEEVAKICFCMTCISNIFFTIIQSYNNDHGTIKYLTLFAFCMIGLFGLPLLPVS